MNKERMIETIKLLRNKEKVETVCFDYSRWGQLSHSCGTVACAGGLMVLHPVFQEQGLDFRTPGDLCPIYRVDENTAYMGCFALGEFLGIDLEDAVTAFADLDEYLMIEIEEVTPDNVADFLEQLMKDEEEKGQNRADT